MKAQSLAAPKHPHTRKKEKSKKKKRGVGVIVSEAQLKRFRMEETEERNTK
jgi:hypothetical protein